MQAFAEFVPWIVFGVVYKFWGGIYPATAALMASMVLLLAFDWFSSRKIPQMHVVLAVLVWLFGAATLILHDVRFLQWKASVFYWLLGLALGASVFIGKQTLLERLLGKGLPEDIVVPVSRWRNLSLISAVFYIALGFTNIWVARTMGEAAWVTFKVWIAIPLNVIFTLGVVFWLLRDMLGKDKEATP
jgi:intracellular septation protein